MVNLGWMKRTDNRADQVSALLSFFAVSSVEQWHARYEITPAVFRLPHAFEPDLYALAAWLRQGERRAQKVECAPFDPAVFKRNLHSARQLTREEDPKVFTSALRQLGSSSGVAIVFVPEVAGSRACGATRWLSPHKAVLQLSLRYKTNDHLWFSFFHEAGHILLHGKREVFVEPDKSNVREERDEIEANSFAADFLISPVQLQKLLEDKPLSRSKIDAFAQQIGIAPGIVVGRLQHDHDLKFNQLNDLKVRYEWSHEAAS